MKADEAPAFEREFASYLAIDPDTVWADVTRLSGINAELGPYLQMRSAEGPSNLAQLQTDAGVRPTVVEVRLGGILPLGRARIEIVELGRRHFTERSNQPGMESWEHRRTLSPADEGCLLVDRLRFTPRFVPRIAAHAIDFLFAHRHRRLRARWNGRAA